MDRRNIIEGNRIEFSVDEMTYLVENYIQDIKGQSVKIDILSHCINYSVRGNINVLLYQMQVKKLIKAFNVALAYYKGL